MFRYNLKTFKSFCHCGGRLISHFSAPHLLPTKANFSPLTPLSFLKRTADLYPKVVGYVDCNRLDKPNSSRCWDDIQRRVARLSNSLQAILGVQREDVVSILAANSPSIFESHFAVPGAGAILHTINTRLDAATIAYQLHHCEAKVVIIDYEFAELAKEAKEKLASIPGFRMPIFVLAKCPDSLVNVNNDSNLFHHMDYESLIEKGSEDAELIQPNDENDAITLNYTSGTTGNPKGVVTSHRGSYLNSISNAVEWTMPKFSRFLWIVPMFHCNGWCFPWTLTATASTSYLLRQVRAPIIYEMIERFQINYLSGAPITMNTLLVDSNKKKFSHSIKMWVAGAPPPPAVIKQFQAEIGITVQTAYGLTETYGPISTHKHDPQWDTAGLSSNDILNKCIYQARNILQEDLVVMDPKTMQRVPSDGKTMGEVMTRGNIVMKGYLKNPSATAECFEGGWFRSGDLGVCHGNGRIELKDRSKDIIISGGENISSIEVENIMMTHGSIMELAVIAKPDDRWGEIPVAFVSLKPNASVTEAELIAWCRTKMAKFQAPKQIYFGSLPKTSTGKIQKAELRKRL